MGAIQNILHRRVGPRGRVFSYEKRTLPHEREPRLSAVLPADPREVQALEEFIALKERQINRLVRVDENLDAILETEWLKDYMLTFPNRDRSGATMLLFWPEEIMTNEGVNLGEWASTSVHRSRYGETNVDLFPSNCLWIRWRIYLMYNRADILVPATTHHLEQAGQIGHGRPHVHGWEQ